MSYTQKNYDNLLGVEGLSDELLKNHFTLYEGYVKNVNNLTEQLGNLDNKSVEYAELKRRFGWEWDGMRLHELYFENMTKGGKALDKNTDLYKKITRDFGSFENWEGDFRAIGTMRGIGWVVLYYDKGADKLINTWIGEHDGGHLTGCTPLLVMDVFEHAYMLDYGLARADYIGAFMSAVEWDVVGERI